ncbi:acetyl-CoA carboxylase biotin carboxyl carrier protein [Thermosporothrix hazakensis]|jgi:biotin carboxyl carrier protein|uniref:Biotin carboxyl carrier protein of acetyl-CoA carboxylase n=2 Tax=Thermosporothrix TaxID=768650 RepID=A0A326TU02_THEHA|nr:biotin/lipoyl-containing protein [Thermosporothrix hazakensis]PZW19375.1 acetyl-CoA carboxylase biotin carboxyl carrier protein [Thermosporothrix hazakensis]BBH89846.1 acetyl-CoA carboxylase, biotin carboxyl carrier protein [Thermosporothrix sp. COM3]GCE48042.1 acetyl-CoA carboxylase, biotin carboxyl carrier protein [Thermosporothrix hazakensis]
MKSEKNTSWLERVEAIVQVLEGSSIGELELAEGDLEITVRRDPGVVLVSGGGTPQRASGVRSVGKAEKATKDVAINAPLTGVYYTASSPSTPPFVNVGDTISVGQVVALIESMKVFNEVVSDVSGRVTAILANNGDVVQKGSAIIRVEPNA